MSPPRPRAGVTTALGITLILSWGSSYYLLAVLAAPVARDTGWPMPWVVSGLSIGLLVSGLGAPLAGRAIDRHGGRPILAVGSLLLAAGLAAQALSPTLTVYLAAWAITGAGMSATLYDAAFAAVGRFWGRDARGAITTLTLWAGFASTACWPLSAWLTEAHGWRATCLAYAALHVLVALPLHLLAIPRAERAQRGPPSTPSDPTGPILDPPRREVFALLATVVTLKALVASTLSVHLIALLGLRGIDLAAAVALGAVIGPAQVGARLLEALAGRRHHPAHTMTASAVLIAVGLVLLTLGPPLAALALIFYGAGNGLHTIARGALPLVLFDARAYPVVMGRLALPSLVVQALAPVAGAWILVEHGGLMLGALTAVALLALLLSVRLGCFARASPPDPT